MISIDLILAISQALTRFLGLKLLDKVRTWSAAIATFAGAAAALAALVTVITGFTSTEATTSPLTWIVAGIAALIGAIPAALFALRRLATRRLDVRIGGAAVELGDDPNDDLLEQLLEQMVVPGSDTELQRQRIQRYMVDDSSLRREVESRALEFMPRRPRSMKRAVNHLRLQLALVVTRNVLGGSPPIETNHVAKWVVFGYRWPALAAALTRNPSMMAELEQAATASDLATILRKTGIKGITTEQLLEFLTERPRLAPVLERLVGLRAVAKHPLPVQPVARVAPRYG